MRCDSIADDGTIQVSNTLNNVQPKFILTTNGTLRLGLVKRHTELIKPGERCIGGGFYELDHIGHRLLLNGASSEYGEPAWERIDKLILSPYYQGLEIIYTSWDKWKEPLNISETKEVAYE